MLHPAVEGGADAPPSAPAEGDCWIVGISPSGEWAEHAEALACRQAGSWLFVTPRDGLRVLDKSAGREAFYRGGWRRAPAIPKPTGGSTIDNEARVAISLLIDALSNAGILPAS